jgi:hypothetical protein
MFPKYENFLGLGLFLWNEMGGKFSTDRGEKMCIQGFGWETWRKTLLGKQGVDGKIILKWFFGIWDGGMDWIDVAPDRGRWRAVVNAVMKLRVP